MTTIAIVIVLAAVAVVGMWIAKQREGKKNITPDDSDPNN